MKKLAFAALTALVSASAAHAQTPGCTVEAVRAATHPSQVPCTADQARELYKEYAVYQGLTPEQILKNVEVMNAFFAQNPSSGAASNPFLR